MAVSKYNTALEVWGVLGEDAFTKVRAEAVGTGDGTTTEFSFDKDNLISGSVAMFTGGTSVTSSAFTLDLDDGKVTFTVAPLNSSVITGDYNYSALADSSVQAILLRADEEMESRTGRNFDLTTTSEFLDAEKSQKTFFLENKPVVSITNLSSNTAGAITDAPSWKALTEGVGNDYISYLSEGRLEFIDNFIFEGFKRLQATYVYGATSANMPDLVKELHSLLSIRSMRQNTVIQAVIKGRDNFSPAPTEQINLRINEIIKLLAHQKYERI